MKTYPVPRATALRCLAVLDRMVNTDREVRSTLQYRAGRFLFTACQSRIRIWISASPMVEICGQSPPLVMRDGQIFNRNRSLGWTR